MRDGATGEAKRTRNHAIWIGPLVTFLAVVSYFQVFARYPVLRDFPWVNLPLAGLGVALSVLGVWRAFAEPRRYRGRFVGPLGALVSLGLAGLFVAYVFVISGSMPDQSPAGRSLAEMPAVELVDHLGRPVQTVDLRGKKVVLTFFRGHW